jgi:peptide deformylase
MAILPLVIAPDPRLKVPSEPVKKVDDSIRKLMDDMLETMYASGGIGLAAVQVGVHKRILVMDIEHGSARYPGTEGGDKKPIFMVNPEIVKESEEENTYEEGCLSFPGQYADVVRPKRVTIKYLDYDGKSQTLEADELFSTCVQHEIDHLNGVVFVDHISRLKRQMIMKKLEKSKKNS